MIYQGRDFMVALFCHVFFKIFVFAACSLGHLWRHHHLQSVQCLSDVLKAGMVGKWSVRPKTHRFLTWMEKPRLSYKAWVFKTRGLQRAFVMHCFAS